MSVEILKFLMTFPSKLDFRSGTIFSNKGAVILVYVKYGGDVLIWQKVL